MKTKDSTLEKSVEEIQRLRQRIATLEALESQHKQTEEALQKSALQYHSTLDSMGDAIHVIDKGLRFVMLNHAMRQWNQELGLETDAVNRTVFEVFPFLPASVRDEYRQVFKTGETIVTEERTMLAGKEFITETRKIPVFEGNSVARVITVLRNITEQKQIEERLQQQQERLQAIMDASPVAISWAALEGGTLEYNNRMHRTLFGYTLDDIPTIAEWRRKAFPDEAYRATIPTLLSVIREAQKKGEALRPIEVAVTCKDGSIRFVMMTGAIVSNRIVAIFSDITKRKQAEEEIKRGYEQLRETLIATVNALASTVEIKDPYTAGHQRRTTLLACAIATEMGLSEEQIEGIRMATLIHDIGKISVPTEILSNPGHLSEVQYDMIKVHPQVGYDILREIKFPWPVAEIVLQHHERFNGSGYPQGLAGDAILLEARILTVADTVEAMASRRPYRVAQGVDMALTEVTQNRGTFFDPQVVDCCLRIFAKGFRFE